MSETDEFSVDMVIPKDVSNINVAKSLDEVFFKILSSSYTKAIICKMLPEENKIYIKPFKWLKLKKVDSWFEVNTQLKDTERERWKEHFSFMFAETIVDIWNKFMPMEFVLIIDENDPYSIKIGWDEGLSKEQIDAYWFKDNCNGYNPDAKFWTREWLKDEHKQFTTGGGKV